MDATPCIDCPLRALPLFLSHTEEELALVQYLKRREITLDAGATVIHEGQAQTRLFTLLGGWAYHFKTLSDGRRQILSFLLAGDFIGVQQKMSEAAAHEESLVDDNLLSLGRRSAEERVATALILLHKRAAALVDAADRAGGVPFPVTQQHLADALGLSLAHTNKTLRKLQRRGLYRIADGRLALLDPQALARLADLYRDGRPPPRPLV